MKHTTSLLLLTFLFAVSSFAQLPAPQQTMPPSVSAEAVKANPRVKTLQLDSKLMGRSMPYRVILPAKYNDKHQAATRYPVMYLLHGLSGHFDNWSQKTGLIEYSANANWIIVTPEGENGWYTDNLLKPNDKYESYIAQELIAAIDKDFRTIAERRGRVIAGLSMGGFGALKFGLKYPAMYSLAGSFSGAVGASSYRTTDELPNGLKQVLVATFGEPASETHKANDLFGLVMTATPEKVAAMPYIYISCGTEDFLSQNNRDFVGILNQKKVPHEYRELPGAHNWAFWDDQFQEFLRLAERRMKR